MGSNKQTLRGGISGAQVILRDIDPWPNLGNRLRWMIPIKQVTCQQCSVS